MTSESTGDQDLDGVLLLVRLAMAFAAVGLITSALSLFVLEGTLSTVAEAISRACVLFSIILAGPTIPPGIKALREMIG